MAPSDPGAPRRDAPSERGGASKPATGLPQARRSFALPLLLALAVFALVIGARLLWGALEGDHAIATSPEQIAPAPAEAEGAD